MNTPTGRDFEKGTLLGVGSKDRLDRSIIRSVGEWATIVPYLDELPCKKEFELVGGISHFRHKPMILTPTLRVCLAAALARSNRGILVSVEKFITGGVVDEGGGEV